MTGCIADTAFRARDGVDQGQQPLNSAMLACGYHPHSRGYAGQQELISSWKTLQNPLLRSAVSLASVKQPLLLTQGNSREPLNLSGFNLRIPWPLFPSLAVCLWRPVPVLSTGWHLQTCLEHFFDFIKVRTQQTFAPSSQQKRNRAGLFRWNILSGSPQMILKRMRKLTDN